MLSGSSFKEHTSWNERFAQCKSEEEVGGYILRQEMLYSQQAIVACHELKMLFSRKMINIHLKFTLHYYS